MLRRSRFWIPVLGLALLLSGVIPARAQSERLRAAPLSRLCRELSTRYGETLRVERGLGDLRVLWPGDAPDARAAVDRLAELTDALVDARDGANGRKSYTLERKVATVRREELWKTEAIASGMRQLARAYERVEKGDPGAADHNASAFYLKRDYLQPGGRCLRSLGPEQLQALARGEEVRLPAGFLSEAECQRMFRGVWSLAAQGGGVPDVERAIGDGVDAARRDGVGIRLDVDREANRTSTMAVLLTYGPPSPSGRSASIAVGSLSDAELGLPLTHTNPYRLLERNPNAGLPAATLSAALRKPLDAPLVLPSGATWPTVLQAWSRATHLPAVSDDYLCRRASNSAAGVWKGLSVEQGVSAAEALDRLCEAFNYLWWERNGCCYLSSRYWPYDVETEVPPAVVEAVATALERGQPLGVGEMRALASLTRRQMRGLFRLRVEGMAFREQMFNLACEGVLRLYSRGDAAGQAALLGPGAPVRTDAEPAFTELAQLGEKGPQIVTVQLEQAAEKLPEPSSRGWKLRFKLSLTRQGRTVDVTTQIVLLIPKLDPPMP